MRRREFIAGLGGAAAWPVVARAQATLLNNPSLESRCGKVAAFRRNLAECGDVEGAINMAASEWEIQWSPGMPPTPFVDLDGSGWHFAFPTQDGVHYVTKPGLWNLQHFTSMQFDFEITGDSPVFKPVADPAPKAEQGGRLRFMIERVGDDMTAANENWRWWARTNVVLGIGSFSFRASLKPSDWFNVFGHSGDESAAYTDGFIHCIRNAGRIGPTFGWTFAGHGVYLNSGNASFHAKRLVFLL